MFIVFACMLVQGVFAQAQKEEINKLAFELRWQLHRYKWFTLMGKVYRLTKNEKYATECKAEKLPPHRRADIYHRHFRPYNTYKIQRGQKRAYPLHSRPQCTTEAGRGILLTINTPINYANYYFLESLCRYKKISNKKYGA